MVRMTATSTPPARPATGIVSGEAARAQVAAIQGVQARNPGQRGDQSDPIDAPSEPHVSDSDGDWLADREDDRRWRAWP